MPWATFPWFAVFHLSPPQHLSVVISSTRAAAVCRLFIVAPSDVDASEIGYFGRLMRNSTAANVASMSSKPFGSATNISSIAW